MLQKVRTVFKYIAEAGRGLKEEGMYVWTRAGRIEQGLPGTRQLGEYGSGLGMASATQPVDWE